MRTFDAEILMVPGWTGSGPDHWQSRWQRRLRTARRVEQQDWGRPERSRWTARLIEAVAAAESPVVIVAHSCGVLSVVHAAPSLPAGKVVGAFLVAVPDLEGREPIEAFMREHGGDIAFPEDFLPLPHDPLPFPSLLVASRTDPYCDYNVAGELALAWGSTLVDAGDVGHLNTASGHGPWPEGAMRFGWLLKQLG